MISKSKLGVWIYEDRDFFCFLSIFLISLELWSSSKNLSDCIVWFENIYASFKETLENQ